MKRSYVYFNLQRRVWSERQAGKVIGHPDYIVLRDARFLVGNAGQKRVRAEGRNNVHAGVSGERWAFSPYSFELIAPHIIQKVTYNPYRDDTFISTADGSPVYSADFVEMVAKPDHKPEVFAINILR